MERAVNDAIKDYDLHHFRRFVKPEQLPPHLKRISHFRETIHSASVQANEAPLNQECKPLHQDIELREPQLSTNSFCQPVLHFLVCTTSALSSEEVLRLLTSLPVVQLDGLWPSLRIITVPLLPPTSVDQATRWSHDFWPTIYKKNNLFGPHPSVLSHAEAGMLRFSREWMNVAETAGIEVSEAQIGEPIGAVVVDRTSGKVPSSIVAAGDARWYGLDANMKNGSGNVMAHAVMRAIGLIASKRRGLTEQTLHGEAKVSKFLADEPLTPIETDVYSKSTLSAGGYLCLGLDIYVTHEPCTMCSMAILHSRFSRVIFGQRLPRTGAMVVEPSNTAANPWGNSESLNYGLFWRPELNWKLLAWQWINADCSLPALSSTYVHA